MQSLTAYPIPHMKAQRHCRNIPSDYLLVQRPIKSPNLPSWGRDYLEISGKKLACKQPWKGRDAHKMANPSKEHNWKQPRDHCANRMVLRFDTVPKAPASPECAPHQYRQILFVFIHIPSWVWKLINSQLKNTWSPSYSWKMVRFGNPCTHSQVNYQLEESITPSTRHQIANLVTLLSRIQFIPSTPHCTPGLTTSSGLQPWILTRSHPHKMLENMCRLLLPRSYFNILLCGPAAKAKFVILNCLHFALHMIMSWISLSNGHVTAPFSNGFKTKHHDYVHFSIVK